MKIIIAGSRSFVDYELLKRICLDIIVKEQYDWIVPNNELEIVSGHAPKGADALGEKFAKEYKLSLKLFPADWKKLDTWPVIIKKNDYGQYNALAGTNRNTRMAEYIAGEPENFLIAFNMGTAGTKDMIKKAKTLEIKIYNIDCREKKSRKKKLNEEI